MPGDVQRRRVTQPVRLTLERETNGIFLPLRLGLRVVKFLVDTGACWTLMSLQLLEACGLRDAMSIVAEGGLVTIGVLEAEAECEGGYALHFVVAIMPRLDTPLLGMNFLLRYGCLLTLDPELPLMTVRPPSQVQLGLLCGVYKKCMLGSHLVTAILDTGSTHSFISLDLAREFKMSRRFCRPMLVTLFDGSITIMFRKIPNAIITIDGIRYITDLIIHPNRNVSLLLGMNILYGSDICLHSQEINLSTTTSCYYEGEQTPKPSSISLMPPQFSVLSHSSRLVSSCSKKTRFLARIKKLFMWMKWGGNNMKAGSINRKDDETMTTEQSGSDGKVESEGTAMTTSDGEVKNGSSNQKGSES